MTLGISTSRLWTAIEPVETLLSPILGDPNHPAISVPATYDYYEPIVTPDQFLYFEGLSNVRNDRLFALSKVNRQFSLGRFDLLRDYDLRGDIESAFFRPFATKLSLNGAVRDKQDLTIDGVVATAVSNLGIVMLLRLMKERLVRDYDDHYSHNLRVGIIYASLREVFDPDNQLKPETLKLAGIMHDVGKLEVEQEILFSGQELNVAQTEAMRMHNDCTLRALMPFHSVFPYLAAVAVYHHPYSRRHDERRITERRQNVIWVKFEQRTGEDRRQCDRRGYKPHIERAGMLLRLADIYDALAIKRGYKEPYPESLIRSIMLKEYPGYAEIIEYMLANFPCPVR